MSLRSPLGRVLGSGSAKDGTGHWWAQRVSAVALLILGSWFLLALQQLPGLQFEQVTTWIARPLNSVMLMLLCVTLAFHSSLGVQVVIEDYVHGPFIKVISLILSKFIHFFLAAAALFAVLKIALGSSV
jgi:succinate dehydrogenase / fumarate reductase membrane anchor subunit